MSVARGCLTFWIDLHKTSIVCLNYRDGTSFYNVHMAITKN